MEKSIEEFLVWYEKNRRAFVDEIYLSKTQGRWFEDFRFPFTDWDCALVLKSELSFNVKALAKLHEYFVLSASKNLENDMLLVVLALKNRIEYISTGVDNYAPFTAAIVFWIGVVSLFGGITWKISLGVAGFVVVATFFLHRLRVRRYLSRYRELINILETYRQQLGG
jgi:hypothetical protein